MEVLDIYIVNYHTNAKQQLLHGFTEAYVLIFAG